MKVLRFGMRRRVLALAGVLVGCSPAPVEHRIWDSLSEDELQTRLESPTADLTLGLTPGTMSDLESRLPALLEMSRFLGQLIDAVAEVAKTDYSSKEQQLPELKEAPPDNGEKRWGTNLYLRLACPGKDPLGVPQRDFSAGDVRLDSGVLKSLDLRALLSGGEFLLSFNRCELGPMTFDAEIPGRYTLDVSRLKSGSADTELPPLALAISGDGIDYEGTGIPLGVLLVGCGGSGSCRDDLRVAAEFKTGAGSFVATFRALQSFWSGQTLSFRLDGRGTSSVCEYTNSSGTGSKLSCQSE